MNAFTKNAAMLSLLPKSALILETNNLRGGDGSESARSLERLLRHMQGQTLPLRALKEVVITHDGLSEADKKAAEDAAGRPLRFLLLPPDTGYYEAKNHGFAATTAELVIFADSDCWPEPTWLQHLLAPFADSPDAGPHRKAGSVQVTAGRTSYRDDVLGSAATAIDFMYFLAPGEPHNTRNFYANNVAFRREVFATFGYQPAPGIYRGHCQVLGMRLWRAGVPVQFVPQARTTHRFPDRSAELLHLRLLRGADTVEITPFLMNTYLPAPLRALGRLPIVAPISVLLIRLGFSMRAVGKQDMTELQGAKYLGCLAAVLGLSVADMVGLMLRGLGVTRFDVHDGALLNRRLSYHSNSDGLTEARSNQSAASEMLS